MNRRDFSARLALSAAALTGFGLGGGALAQQGGVPVEGTHYARLSQPLPMASDGKIEVIEFFWYGCPHCHQFEPMLEAWLKKLPADVNFRRVPVAFREEPFAQHQKIFYTLEALGKVDELHRKVFHAIHVERQRLDKPADIAAWMGKNGVDPAKYNEMSNSFAVQTKLRQAKQLAEAYKIDGVPAIGIHGRYYTSGSLAGGNEQMLSVTNFLIGRLRKA
jgi:thiol:disulfide interchange protein DsbA